MTSTDTLLPCPFCGGDAEVREWDFPYVRFQARCLQCKTTGRTRFNERAKAIAAWNRRTPPTPATDAREAVARAIGDYAATLPDESYGSHLLRSHRIGAADAALSALAPVRAAEILAAEARGYAKAIEDAANVVSNKGHTGLPYSTVAAIRALRNEHGAGK